MKNKKQKINDIKMFTKNTCLGNIMKNFYNQIKFMIETLFQTNKQSMVI